MRLHKVGDIHLVDGNGNDIGKVDDLILDPETGEILYVVWATGGFLGIGQDVVLIPFENRSWLAEAEGVASHFVLNADKATREGAPHFSSLKDLDRTVQGWDTGIRSFWQNVDTGTNR
jgi:hypothetical protein